MDCDQIKLTKLKYKFFTTIICITSVSIMEGIRLFNGINGIGFTGYILALMSFGGFSAGGFLHNLYSIPEVKKEVDKEPI